MIIVYMYNKNNLSDVIEQYALSFEDYQARVELYYPPYDPAVNVPSAIKFINPIVDVKTGELREKNKDELYAEGLYVPASNEIVENGKIRTVTLSKYEYIEDNQIKFKRDERLNDLKKELYDLRIATEQDGFDFNVNGTVYRQYNRTIDQSNITKVLFSMILNFAFDILKKFATGTALDIKLVLTNLMSLQYPGWKFYTKDGSEKYEPVSVMQFLEMSKLMQKLTTVSMQSETVLYHSLLDKTDDELKEFDAAKEYKEFFENAMKEE